MKPGLNLPTLLTGIILFAGCNFSKSVKKDLISGLLTKGDGLSCDDIYLSVNKQKTSSSTFTYGEEFFINFDNVEGFKTENGKSYPGLQLCVITSSGDTVFQTHDLYESYGDGVDLSPLDLNAKLTVADPMHSNGDYRLQVKIWDKRDKGILTSQLNFHIIPNDQIRLEGNKVSWDEVYLFSKEKGKTITDNKIGFNENVYLICEGLDGFAEDNGMIFPGMSLRATDHSGNILMNYPDLFEDYSASGIRLNDFKSQLSSNFSFTGPGTNNPVHCEWTVWDKKGDARLKVETDLQVE